MLVTRKWHLTCTRTDSSCVTCISVRRATGNVLFALAILVIAGILAGSFFIGGGLSRLHRWNDMNSRNAALRAQLDGMLAQLDGVEDRLELMQAWEDRVREDEHLHAINPTLREAGAGGAPRVDSRFAARDARLHESYNHVLDRMRHVRSVTDMTVETHREVLDKVSVRDEIFRNTPSIYPAFGRFSSSYGWRTHPVTGRRDFHHGLDISNAKGTPIYATADGVVGKTTYQKNIGKYIEIRHGYGYVTRYGHLDQYLVEPGDEVTKGQIIALMGQTGRTTGPHVHYEVLHYGKHRNPWYFLNKTEDEIDVTDE